MPAPKLVPRFVVRLDDPTYDVLRRYAFEHQTTQSAIVRRAVREFLRLETPPA